VDPDSDPVDPDSDPVDPDSDPDPQHCFKKWKTSGPIDKKLFQETREGEAYCDQEGDEDLVHPVRPQHQLLRLPPATEKEETGRETQNKGKAPQNCCRFVSARFVIVRINIGAQLISFLC
jgi:hypothetical protein